jgi:tryptophan halogenase
MINSIGILGGGNAGFISALMLRAAFPNLKISVIKSSKISTIGVGEGSNEHWLEFASIVGITTEDVIKEADATFKHGIKFIDWCEGDDTYYHSLPEFLAVQDQYTGLPYTLMRLISEGIDSKDLVWSESAQGKIPSPFAADFSQFHFNTFKLNDFLERLCGQRNITVTEDHIVDVLLDQEGYVASLKGEKGNHLYDFYIDTSGFQRVINKKLGAKWQSYSQYLPINSAIAFPSAVTNESTPTFTETKARKYGWSWRAPVQGRYGNGYVYSDAHTTVDSAVAEMQADYVDPINVAKEIKFDSGKVDKFWIKNSVSVGLSGSFIEPLEASNIGTTINQIKCLMTHLPCWSKGAELIERKYNNTFNEVAENILDFVQLHYISKREDTEFWQWCKYDMPLTEFNQQTLEHFKSNFVSYNFFHRNNYELFDELDWIQVMHGLKLFNVESIKDKYQKFKHLDNLSKMQCNSVINNVGHRFYTHDEAIKIIKDQR